MKLIPVRPAAGMEISGLSNGFYPPRRKKKMAGSIQRPGCDETSSGGDQRGGRRVGRWRAPPQQPDGQPAVRRGEAIENVEGEQAGQNAGEGDGEGAGAELQ